MLVMSGIWLVLIVRIPNIKDRCPEYGQFSLSMFWTSKIDVRIEASFDCPCSGSQKLMSGIWTIKTGHILDIVHIPDIARCLEYDLIRTSHIFMDPQHLFFQNLSY